MANQNYEVAIESMARANVLATMADAIAKVVKETVKIPAAVWQAMSDEDKAGVLALPMVASKLPKPDPKAVAAENSRLLDEYASYVKGLQNGQYRQQSLMTLRHDLDLYVADKARIAPNVKVTHLQFSTCLIRDFLALPEDERKVRLERYASTACTPSSPTLDGFRVYLQAQDKPAQK